MKAESVIPPLGSHRRWSPPPTLVVSGLFLIILGFVVLVGWQSSLLSLQTIIPGTTKMSPLTAALFILLGSGLITLETGQRWPARIIGGAVALIGLMIGARLLLHWPLYPERILFPRHTTTSSFSVLITTNFVLSGCMVYASSLRHRWKRAAIRVLSVLIGLFSLLAIVAYLLGIRSSSTSLNLISMAIHTAVGFLVIALALFLYNERLKRGQVRRRVLALFAILGVLIVFNSALAYQNVQRLIATQNELQSRVQLQTVLDSIVSTTLEAETSQRGFLLTTGPTYAASYSAAIDQLRQQTNQLLQLSQGNPHQAQLANQLSYLVGEKESELAQTMSLMQGGQSAAALAVVQTGTGELYESQIQQIAGQLEAFETKSYSAAVASAHQIIGRTTLIVVGACVLNILLIALVVQIILVEAANRLERQRELEHTLRLVEGQKAQDEALLSSIGDGVFAIDPDGQIILFNEAASEITGFTETDALGKPYEEILTFSFELSGRVNKSFVRRALNGQRTKMSNHTMVHHKSGRLIPVADSAAPIFDAQGRVSGVIVVFRDATQEYAIERAKDEFVSLASHQLRTPATGVKQYLAMLLEGYGGSVKPKQLEMIERAYASNERQLKVLQDMLNVANIDAGHMVLNLRSTNLATLIGDIVAEHHATFAARNQTISVRLPKAPPRIMVDPIRLRMVIENLLSNAAKYTPNGGSVRIELRRRNNEIAISVQDSGVGIAESHIPRLFDKFVRIHNELSAEVGGSGLGLYLARQIVALHKGSISVTSQLGHGTTFTILLPRKR